MRRRTRGDTRQARRRRTREGHPPARTRHDPASSPGPSPVAGRLKRLGRLYGLDDVRRHGPVIWLLSLGTVASYVGRGAVMPFVLLYLTLVKGAIGLTDAGLGIALEQILRALLSPVFGTLSDRHGRKPFVLLGLSLQALTLPAYALVDGVGTYLLICGLAGLGQAPYQPAFSALVADLTPASRSVGVFGLVHMMKNLGYGLGIVAGSLLVHQGFALLFVTGGLFPLAYALLVLFAIPEPARTPPTGRPSHPVRGALDALRDRRFAAFLVVATVTFVSWGAAEYLLPVYIKDARGLGLSETWVSRAFMLNSALIVLFQVPISERLATRIPRTHGLALATAVTSGACALLALVLTATAGNPALVPAGLLLAMAILTFAEMLDTPLLFSLAADLAPPHMTGGAMGVLGLAAPLGLATPLVLAGLLRHLGGWPLAWGAFTAILLAGAAGYTFLRTTPAPAPFDADRPSRAPAASEAP